MAQTITEKAFLDVFPTIKLNKDLNAAAAELVVTHISMNSARTAVKIYIKCERLIPKLLIMNLEDELVRQIRPFSGMQINIIERYYLSTQYNLEALFEAYLDSFLLELKDKNVIEYNILKSAGKSFEDENTLLLTVDDSFVTKNKSMELSQDLKDILVKRFGFDVDIRLTFVEHSESRYKKEADYKLQQLIADISEKTKTEEQPDVQPVVKPAKAEESKPKQDKPKSGDKKEFSYNKSLIRSDNPEVIYGRDFDDEAIELDTVITEMGEITFRGQIINLDKRELRNEKTIVMFDVTDFTDTITVKLFIRNEQLQEFEEKLTKGIFVKIKGVTNIDKFDGELTIGSVAGIKKISDFRTKRLDTAMEKRVELHCHTKMSELDGVSDAASIVKRAAEWGQPALAITDHGVVQAFPEAFHTAPKELKLIYGVEAYLVDDLKGIIENSHHQNFDDAFVVFDLETTGLSPVDDKIIEIGAIKIEKGKVVDNFSTFVNPEVPIPFRIEQLTGINDSMVMEARTIGEILPEFLEFCGDSVMVAHNASFDVSFIKEKTKQLLDKEFECTVVDTVALARALMPQMNRFKLDTVAKALNVSLKNHHRAVDDAMACAGIFLALVKKLNDRDIFSLDGINDIEDFNVNAIRKMNTHHAIIIATNDVGRVNMYKLITMSHMIYYHRKPRIPKSEFLKYREGLLIGSACEAGELYQAILSGQPTEEIVRLVDFYDYLEIQPLGNNKFMIAKDDIKVDSFDDLKEINKKIVMLGEKFNKPVVATCDVHFLNPEDELYRRIIMKGQGFDDADEQAPLYLRTTEEMLSEFTYLGEDKAYEVVVTNTRLIADMCEPIDPVRPDKCPPIIPHSDETLKKICYDRAHEIYGEELPKIVEERLERELHSIITNGYSVMYIIAQKLVWKSNEDGYLVGSRGSVGSSLVATMAGITEVNPLSPHYLCSKCHYVDFDSEDVKAFSGGAGCDMPDKVCPKCGEKLQKMGFDIPFETFLGFKGDKEPDIDLNFSNEYQSKAHAYTEVIFGAGQTFKAGTIGTLADKTVYGYIKNYYDETDRRKRKCEINRNVGGCVGVKRSTGQHPGGIIVLPYGEDIDSFTPVQHPANDMTTSIVTTHFDYHSIDHNLLKLDILGHLDPTMIRMLQDLTGIDPKEIPLDSKEVMSLFKDTSALGILPEDIGGCKLGALGIPEFGTDFAMQMLIDTKPQFFSDLVRIAGLSHGTDVWLGNAKELIDQGNCTISTAICTRDDIMIYLISMGIEAGLSFTIMEAVRKGKGLKEDWIKVMTEAGVPEWYIWSCKKIKYMFPKAHAAAYVMMAWRVAYCKVFYPLAYYAAYFSIRANGFSYKLMCLGKEKLNYHLEDYKKRADTLTGPEQESLKDMRLVQEMYARGLEFLQINLFKSHARNFQIVDGKLLPPFKSIDGLGETAADSIMAAAENGPFLSKEDFRVRCKVSTTVIQELSDLGILEGLPETNQLSLFDF